MKFAKVVYQKLKGRSKTVERDDEDRLSNNVHSDQTTFRAAGTYTGQRCRMGSMTLTTMMRGTCTGVYKRAFY